MPRHRHSLPAPLLTALFFLALVTACTPGTQPQPPEPQAQHLSTVALLPVSIPPADPRQPPDSSLESGRAVLQQAITAVLHERGLRLAPVPARAMDALAPAAATDPAASGEIARRFGASGVLAVELRRYRDRQGSAYAAVQPAAVAFSYRLTAADGTLLCAGTVEAEQQSALANLFRFSFKGGFRWLSGPEFVRQTVADKLATCPALTPR